jgi:hypothetical protein
MTKKFIFDINLGIKFLDEFVDVVVFGTDGLVEDTGDICGGDFAAFKLIYKGHKLIYNLNC